MKEREAITRLFMPIATGREALGLKDDAALVVPPPGEALVLSKDMLSESVHFLEDTAPQSLALKLLAVNYSDLAAMGAYPFAVLVGLGLTDKQDMPWLESFASGLSQGLERWGGALWGGDTILMKGPLTLSATVVGRVPEGMALPRCSARPGDDLYVSGQIGGAMAGLCHLRQPENVNSEAAATLVDTYLHPQPRLGLGCALRGVAHSCTDVSDGLIADIGQIVLTNGLSAQLWLDKVPLPEGLNAFYGMDPLQTRLRAVTGGDDYELLFTAAVNKRGQISGLSKELDVSVTRIGTIAEGSTVEISYDPGSGIRKEIHLEDFGLSPGYEHG